MRRRNFNSACLNSIEGCLCVIPSLFFSPPHGEKIMQTTTVKEILEEYKTLVDGKELSEEEDSYISIFIKFNNEEGFLEVMITDQTSFKPLKSDTSVLLIQEIYIQESKTHENNYYIDCSSVQCISDCDF